MLIGETPTGGPPLKGREDWYELRLRCACGLSNTMRWLRYGHAQLQAFPHNQRVVYITGGFKQCKYVT